MNAADLLCMQECRQTKDRTNGHLVDSNTLLIELSSPLVIARRLRAKFWPDCAILDTSLKFGTVVDHD